MRSEFDRLVLMTVAKDLSLNDLLRDHDIGRTTALKVVAAARGFRLAQLEHQQRPMDILVIGDAHAEPGEDMAHFSMFGRVINDLRPDVVVCIGDWADMPSLSGWDKGKRSFEGRRYKADIAAANEALALMEAEISYHPRKVFVTGNHEYRIERAMEDRAELEGLMSLNDLDIYRTWESYDFLEPVEIGGVLFAHYFISGIMGKPIGGVNKGRSLILKTLQSTVSGHSHELHHAIAYRADGSRVHGLDVGCAFDSHHAWAGQSNKRYWRGLCYLRGVRNGEMDVETISFHELRRRYPS